MTAVEGGSGQPPTDASLQHSLARGLLWTASAKWGVQLLSWGGTIIVARLLTPGDYGIVGMAMVYLGFVQLVNEFGLGTVMIQQRSLTQDGLAKLGGLAVAVGVLLCGVSAAVAPLVAGLFGEPAVTSVLVVLSATFVTGGLQLLPVALLNRELRFRTLAALDAIQALTSLAVTFVLAVQGQGYWALVIGNVAGNVLSCTAAVACRPHRVSPPIGLRSLSPQMRMGLEIVAARIAWYVYSNADFAIVGRFLGSAALGAYTFAWQLSNMPLDKIGAVLTRVALPLFSSLQADRSRLASYLRRMTEGLTLVTFPASVGIALVARDAVPIVLGERWNQVIVPLTVLALGVGVRSLGPMFPAVLMAVGETRRNAQFALMGAVVMPTLFLLGSRWGLAGVAAAWTVGHPLLVLPVFVTYTLRQLGVPVRSYFAWLWPAVSGSAVMATAVLGAAATLPSSAPHVAQLAVKVGTGVAAYGLYILLTQRTRVHAAKELLRAIRAREPGT